MDIKEQIQNWLVKGDALSPDDKKAIKAAAQEAELEVTFKSKCSSCYTDAVILLANHYNVKAKDDSKPTTDGGYRFTAKGIVIWYNEGVRYILSASTDPATIAMFIKANPKQKYFVKE